MSKKTILQKLKQNHINDPGLPVIPLFDLEIDLPARFIEMASQSSRVFQIRDFDLTTYISNVFGKDINVVDLTGTANNPSVKPEDIDVLVINGAFGVAENGAVWLTDTHLKHRILPFICQHLIITIQQSSIVLNMHHAYAQINLEDQFGVFIAGPSKTADIEQTLVVGAHGPRSLTLVLE